MTDKLVIVRCAPRQKLEEFLFAGEGVSTHGDPGEDNRETAARETSEKHDLDNLHCDHGKPESHGRDGLMCVRNS